MDLSEYSKCRQCCFQDYRTIRELGQSLSLLPHVHTLRIGSTETELIIINFSRFSFPQIRTLCLQGNFKYENILAAFPNIRNFMQCCKIGFFPLRNLQPYASQIEELGVFSNFGPQEGLFLFGG